MKFSHEVIKFTHVYRGEQYEVEVMASVLHFSYDAAVLITKGGKGTHFISGSYDLAEYPLNLNTPIKIRIRFARERFMTIFLALQIALMLSPIATVML